MRIPANLLEAIPQALVQIFKQKMKASHVVDFYLKNHRKWGSRDRRYFAEKVYDVVRHYRKFWIEAGLPRADYLDTASINLESMQKLFQVSQASPLASAQTFAERESFTDWFDSLGRKEWGNEWESIAKALNAQAPVFLRTNTLKIKRDRLQADLEKEGVLTKVRGENETALELQERKNIFITQTFKQGFCEVQDLSSQHVAPLLNPKPGEKVVDGCAGAGGKTLHLASLMQNRGEIWAFDVYPKKLEELQKRSERAGCKIIKTNRLDKSDKLPAFIKNMENSVDALLLDVPCTGSGVLKRNPDAKWKLTETDFVEVLILQKNILQNYSRVLKKGGRLVYATCSLFPSENTEQVTAFLKQNSDFKLISSKLFRPDRDDGDGFYMALLIKN